MKLSSASFLMCCMLPITNAQACFNDKQEVFRGLAPSLQIWFSEYFFMLPDYWFGIETDVKIKKQKGQREGKGEEGRGGGRRGDEKRRGC